MGLFFQPENRVNLPQGEEDIKNNQVKTDQEVMEKIEILSQTI